MTGFASGRRGLGTSVVALLVGGGVVLVVAQATWLHVSSGGAVVVDLAVQGSEAVPVLVPLALLGLAGVVGIVATRGWLRRVVGLLVAAAGVGLVVASVSVAAHPADADADALRRASLDPGLAPLPTTVAMVWPLLAVLGGLLVVAGGVLAAAWSADWPFMGARYEVAPAAAPGDAWQALDRGEDPTVAEPLAPAAAPADPEVPE